MVKLFCIGGEIEFENNGNESFVFGCFYVTKVPIQFGEVLLLKFLWAYIHIYCLNDYTDFYCQLQCAAAPARVQAAVLVGVVVGNGGVSPTIFMITVTGTADGV